MKKVIYTMVLIFSMGLSTHATNYYVNPDTGLDSNDGTSWATAFKSFTTLDALISSDPANTDNIFIKGGTITRSSQWSPKSQNYYFSCFGNESDQTQRPLEDKDGNGIIEPWEFKYPTVLNSSLTTGYAIGLGSSSTLVSSVVDGLTVTLTGTTATATTKMAAIYWYASTNVTTYGLNTAIFQNGIIKNCNQTYGSSGANNTAFNYGCLVNVADNGVMKDCLIEKNKVTIFSGNNIIIPVASLTLSTVANVTPKVTNVVVRNNYGSITMSGATSTNRLTGLVFGVGVGNATYNTGEGMVTNCLVYNNEITYTGPTGYTQATNASLAGACYSTYGKASYRNCVFAYNKLTNLASGMYLVSSFVASSVTYYYTYTVTNCVFWNSQNNTSNVSIAANAALNVSTTVTNNVMDVDRTGTWGTNLTYTNNLTDLAQTNTGTNAPYFSNPTTFIGTKGVIDANDPSAITQSRWSLKEGSYLNGKGTTYTGISTDLAGNTFASTPSAGAYEYFGYYRSNSNGNWSSASTWQASKDNAIWSANTLPPTSDINSVVIQNGNTVTVAANATAPALTINGGGKLTLNNGNTLNATSLAIGSDVTNGTGTFVDANTASGLTVSGTSSVQQYLNADHSRNWYLSSPVSSATVPVLGYSFWKRDEAANSWPTLNSGNELTPGMGFIVNPTTAPSTYTFTGGQLNSGNVPVILKYSEGVTKAGFNLVGNPYASHVTISKAMTDAANALNTIWYRTVSSYDDIQSKYNYTFQTCVINEDGTYVGTPLGITPIIAPMQSFWVRTSVNNSTLAFTNSIRSHQSSNPLKVKSQKSGSMSILRLQVSNGKVNDETVLYTNANASDTYDSYDAPKMLNTSATIPEIYSIASDKVLAINGFNRFPVDTEIPIGFTTGETNNFTIKASETTNIDNSIILKDNLLNTETDISSGGGYNFVSDATSSVDRFSILFKSPGVTTGINNSYKINNENYVFMTKNHQIGIYSKIAPSQDIKVLVYNVTGQKIAEQVMKSSYTYITVPETGIYMIKINMPEKTESYKIINPIKL